MSNDKRNLTINEAFAFGLEKLNKKEFKLALDIFNNILKVKPDNSSAYNNCGIAHYKLGDYQKAINSFEAALKIKPSFIEPLLSLVMIFKKLGDNKKVEDYYKKIIKIDPNKATAYNDLGNLYLG